MKLITLCEVYAGAFEGLLVDKVGRSDGVVEGFNDIEGVGTLEGFTVGVGLPEGIVVGRLDVDGNTDGGFLGRFEVGRKVVGFNEEGLRVSEAVGRVEGDDELGVVVGFAERIAEGRLVGFIELLMVGNKDGSATGGRVGATLGRLEGRCDDGCLVIKTLGETDGLNDDNILGLFDGKTLGATLGRLEGGGGGDFVGLKVL